MTKNISYLKSVERDDLCELFSVILYLILLANYFPLIKYPIIYYTLNNVVIMERLHTLS